MVKLVFSFLRGIVNREGFEMTDRELLELAAKAAGYPWRNWDVDFHYAMLEQDVSKPEPRIWSPTPWNPLVYDSDAFCLAVKLEMNVFHAAKSAYAVSDDGGCEKQVRYADAGNDPYAATRRAIVRAAAAIGKDMK